MTVNDLATCPYCLETIQRLALRCKHCHATLNGVEPPQVADHGTVGGAGSVTIGGQGHHIEGGIHFTLAELDGVDETTKRQLRIRFEAQVRDYPEQAQYHFALGLSYLDQGLYDLAVPSFRRALGKTTNEADLLYYLSLARLAGKRPRAQSLATIREIESHLGAAIHQAGKAHYKILLAAIKQDYYAANGLRTPPPPADLLLMEAMQSDIDIKEVQQMFRYVQLPHGEPFTILQCFANVERKIQ
jgi:tetratricopeptide (TPR) repeat protein